MHQVAHPPQPGEHQEHHFESTEAVRDIVIGLSDGLTVPFALAAGLSGALANPHLIVLAGLAEIAAGSIAMGLGGYLAARGDAEHYASELFREQTEIVTRPQDEAEEIYEIFEHYSVSREDATPVLHALQQNPVAYVDFMMRFELGLERPAESRAHRSASTIAVSYILGGLVPLLPYMVLTDNAAALRLSVVITLIALALFGAIKGRLVGTGALRSAIQTTLIGGAAAAAAYGLARLLNQHA
jgi:VIT1/CCC1 family predicted Fe2+/Mn2+ transporter